MVYDSDFYTTRRPYSTYSSRIYPSVTSYSYSFCDPVMPKMTTTTTRQIRIVPTLSKIHIYQSNADALPLTSTLSSVNQVVPYTSHNRTTYVLPASTYHVVRVRPSVINREFKRIENRSRPLVSFMSPTLHYLNSDPVVNFQDEARSIRSQAMSLMRQVHAPVPRIQTIRIWPSLSKYMSPTSYYNNPIERSHSPAYVYQMLTPTSRHLTWHYDPITKPILRLTLPRSIGNAHHFAAVDFVGDKVHYRRQHPLLSDVLNEFESTVKNDVNLLSYYIKQKDLDNADGLDDEGNLSPSRPTRHFSSLKQLEFPEPSDELQEMRKERAERLARIRDDDDKTLEKDNKIKKDNNVEKQISESKCELKPEPKKENIVEEVVTEKEPEKSSFQKTDDEILKEERAAKRKRRQTNNMAQIKDKKRSSSSKSEGLDMKEIERLDQLAKEAEADKEAELARQAEELAELARQEAELAAREEKERLEREELARQEAELAELERQARELEEQEAEARRKAEEKERKKAMKEEAERKRMEEELAELERQEAELAELARQEAELAELERQQKEIKEKESQPEPEEIPTTVESKDYEDEIVENIKKDESEEQIVMDKDNEEEQVPAEEEDEVTENTEVLEQEQAELVALAKRAVQLAAMDAEAKALDISDENNNDIDGLKTPDDYEKSLDDEEILPDNQEAVES